MTASRRERTLKGIAAILVLLTVLIAAFGLAHTVTAALFPIVGFAPSPLALQIINSLFGLLLLGLAGIILSRIFKSRAWAQQMHLFGPLLNAMEQIARGDFNVRLEHPRARDPFHEDDPINKLFAGVNQMAQELNQMEAMRQEFISNVSHEIQSPLTSIHGFARALRSDQLSPEERLHYLNIIETESMRLSKLSDNLLALASLESENMQFEPKLYRLDKQIRNLILACEPQWAGKGIDMDVATEEVSIKADEDLLSQVWINLIHNSIKFTPDGGRVCVELRRCNDKVEFRIADTGMGIAEEDQARVFERFFKADTSRNRSLGGSGLGLSIAKRIVEMHQGAINVQSKLGAGSIFTVMLPAA